MTRWLCSIIVTPLFMPMSLTPEEYQQQLSFLAALQQQTIASHILPNQEKLWIRKAGPTNALWRYRLMHLVSEISGLKPLTPIPNPGGVSMIATEIKRIRELHNAGVLVPTILAEQNNALMTRSLGKRNLLKHWRKVGQTPSELLQAWQLGLNAIADVHAKKQYLSQAFARNMMYVNDTTIGFIDFEDDPGTLLSLPLCHARDWLSYLQSGANIMESAGVKTEAHALWMQTLDKVPADVRLAVQQVMRKLRLLKHFNAPWMGKDTLRLSAMARFG